MDNGAGSASLFEDVLWRRQAGDPVDKAEEYKHHESGECERSPTQPLFSERVMK